MDPLIERLDTLLAPAKRSSSSASLKVSNIRDAVETSEVITKCLSIAKSIDEDLDNCTDPNEIRMLFARVLGVQPGDVPMQYERIKEFVNITRDDLCNLLSKNFTPIAINKIHWTMGLAGHVLISCNISSEADRSLAQQITSYLVKEKNMAVYFKKSETSIAIGVERAKAVIVIVSPEFQRNQGCTEELNYCDQCKVPMVAIVNRPNFVPVSWLGSILAAHSATNTLQAADCVDNLSVIYDKVTSLMSPESIAAATITPELVVDLQVWTRAAVGTSAVDFAGDDRNEDEEIAALAAIVNQKKQERTSVILYHTAEQQELVDSIVKELKILTVPVIACSVEDGANAGLEASNKGLVICPLMSRSFEEHTNALKILTYCNMKRLPVVPVKAEGNGYNQSGWLGVICAGLLWFEISSLPQVPSSSLELQKATAEHLRTDYENCSIDVGSGENVVGYYVQNDEKHEMSFDFLSMKSGQISGQGEDNIGMFVLCGDYDSRLTFRFVKQYIGQHSIDYSGNISMEQSLVVLSGSWSMPQYGISDEAEIRLERSPPPPHVMMSYQWGMQPMVKRVAAYLKSQGVRVWLDIDGGMKGNINQAMADGVEGSCVVCSFNTPAYAKSPNCTKEIQYANQLNKKIVLVNVNGVMDYNVTEGLSKIAAKHEENKVVLMQPSADGDETEFLSGLENLLQVVNKLVAEHSERLASKVNKVYPPDIYQGGKATGSITVLDENQEPIQYTLDLNNLGMRKGKVNGYIQDMYTGEFSSFIGTYTTEGAITFIQDFQQTDTPSRYFQGTVERVGGNGFRVSGLWSSEQGVFENDKLVFELRSPEIVEVVA